MNEERDFIIFKDVLMDKEYDHFYEPREDFYLFYFKEYFKLYNKTIRVDKKLFDSTNIGEEFYITCYKSNPIPKIRKVSETALSSEARNNLVNIYELRTLKNQKEINSNIKTNYKTLTRKHLIKKVYTNIDKIIKLWINVAIGFLILLLLCAIIAKNIKLTLIFLVFTLSAITFKSLLFKKQNNIIENLKKGNFYIIKDRIKAINENLEYRYINEIKRFSMTNYNVVLEADIKDFLKEEVQDELYLIFIDENDKEPVAFYSTYNELDDDLKTKLRVSEVKILNEE